MHKVLCDTTFHLMGKTWQHVGIGVQCSWCSMGTGLLSVGKSYKGISPEIQLFVRREQLLAKGESYLPDRIRPLATCCDVWRRGKSVHDSRRAGCKAVLWILQPASSFQQDITDEDDRGEDSIKSRGADIMPSVLLSTRRNAHLTAKFMALLSRQQ